MAKGYHGTQMQSHTRKAAGVTKLMPKWLVKKNNKRRRIFKELARIHAKVTATGFDPTPRLRKHGQGTES